MAESTIMRQTTTTFKPEAGLLETIKENLNPSNLMNKLNITTDTLLEMLLYTGVGFLAGYLLKKYGKFVIVLIAGALGLVFLQQLGVLTITFNVQKFQELFGVQQVHSDVSLVTVYWEWIKTNVALVLGFSIGFLVGLRVG